MILRMDGDSADGDYALSLERINPFPPNAQELKLATPKSRRRGGPFEPADNIYILRGYNRHLPVSLRYTVAITTPAPTCITRDRATSAVTLPGLHERQLC